MIHSILLGTWQQIIEDRNENFSLINGTRSLEEGQVIGYSGLFN